MAVFDGEILDLDFSGVSDLAIIPAGTYPARVDACHAALSKASGEPTLYFEFVLLGPGDLAGRKARHSRSLQKQARPYLRRSLVALGYTKEQLAGHLRVRPEALVDMTCAIRITNEVRDGEPSYSVARMYPITRATGAQIAPAEAPFSDLEDAAFDNLEPTTPSEVVDEPDDVLPDDELGDLDELSEDDFLGL